MWWRLTTYNTTQFCGFFFKFLEINENQFTRQDCSICRNVSCFCEELTNGFEMKWNLLSLSISWNQDSWFRQKRLFTWKTETSLHCRWDGTRERLENETDIVCLLKTWMTVNWWKMIFFLFIAFYLSKSSKKGSNSTQRGFLQMYSFLHFNYCWLSYFLFNFREERQFPVTFFLL